MEDRPIQVLVIESDSEAAAEVVSGLSGPRFEVERAADLRDGLRRCGEKRKDLLLLGLGVSDGEGPARHLQVKAHCPGCAVVVICPAGGEELGIAAVREGAQDYLLRGKIDAESLARAARCAVERRRAGRLPAGEQELLRAVIDSLPDRIYVKDAAGRYVIGNAAHTSFLGVSSTRDVAGKTSFDFFPPEQAEQFSADDQAVMRSGLPMIGREEPTTGPGGELRWSATSKVPLRDAGGNVTGLVAVSRDLTEVKRIEAAMAGQHDLLRALIDSLPDHIYVKNMCGRFLVVNKAVQQFFGAATVGDVTGKTDFDFLPVDAACQFRAEEEEIFRTGESRINREGVGVGRDGEARWLLTTKVPLRDRNDKVIGLVGVNRDITELKAAEQELRNVTTHARCILWHAEVAGLDGWEGDPGGGQLRYDWQVNVQDEHAAQQVLELDVPPGRTYRQAWRASLDDEGRARMDALAARALFAGEKFYTHEFHCADRTGRTRWLREDVTVQPAGRGRWRAFGVVTDVTERRLAEDRLTRANAELARRERELLAALAEVRRSNAELVSAQLQLSQVAKMESVGRLAAGIAHEVKNPLAVITMGLDYFNGFVFPPAGGPRPGGGHANDGDEADAGGTDVGADGTGGADGTDGADEVRSVLQRMGKAARRADAVVRGLLDFSAPKELRTIDADLNAVIEQSLLLVRHELLRCRVSLRLELGESLPPVPLDADKVEQVFVNLFMNAVHAMPGGGSLTIRTRAEQIAALGRNVGDSRADHFAAGDVVVAAEVEDTGQGVPPEKLGKVFDPFFTTKPAGKGTGLGLTVARTIVELHRGVIEMANRPEGGVRVTVLFKASGG